MDRSVRFYRDALGLKLRFQSPDWTEFDLGSTTLALHGGGKLGGPGGEERFAGTASIGFNVDDLDGVCSDLKARGARMAMPPTQREGEGIRPAIFVDPDGMSISFAQTVAESR